MHGDDGDYGNDGSDDNKIKAEHCIKLLIGFFLSVFVQFFVELYGFFLVFVWFCILFRKAA